MHGNKKLLIVKKYKVCYVFFQKNMNSIFLLVHLVFNLDYHASKLKNM